MDLLLLLHLFGTLPLLNAYNILGVFPVCAHSHYTIGLKLIKALVDRGHRATLISCYTQKTPIKNLQEISLRKSLKDLYTKIDEELADTNSYNYFEEISWIVNLGNIFSSSILKSKAVHELINSNQSFDVMIMENTIYDSLSILSYKLKCPLILLSPFPRAIFGDHSVDNLFAPAFVPNHIAAYDSRMNFWERLENTYRQIVLKIVEHFMYMPYQRSVIQEVFTDTIPDLYDVIHNVSLYFVSSNPSLNDPMPLQQNIKEIGGIHVSPPKPLPKDIESFINNATNGVILFSMGSIINSSVFVPQMKNAILRTFSKMEQKVIWKHDDESLEKPNNVMVKRWIPQNDIMAHPNTIVFISHGGILGTYEAIYHGVPILGIPVAWDQKKNIEEAARKGFAIRLNLVDFTEDLFENALLELITNHKYRKNAKKRSRIMHDRISTPLEEAVFWTEYVIRHKGADHLKSSVMDLKWYQKYLVDVFLFITVILFLIIYAVFSFIRMMKTQRLRIKQD